MVTGLALLLAATMAVAAAGLPRGNRPARVAAEPQSFDGQAWKRVPVRPGGMGDARPAPPRSGRGGCIAINGIAGAQAFGDRAIELTMRGNARWRLYLAQECPALSFYQGFYYQQKRAGQLCAGRDAIGARSGGECAIAAIVPVKPQGPIRRRR